MSSTSRGTARGRGRGNAQALRGGSIARGTSASRGTSRGGWSARGNAAPRGLFGQASRAGNGARGGGGGGFGSASGTKTYGFGKQPVTVGAVGGVSVREDWTQRFERLEKARQNERKQAIAKGLVADPDKPRSLADAITPVGTCQEMCAEFERVQRVVQADVWREEADPAHPSYGSMNQEPIEARMVKKFRRAAAGLEEQLPSDLRPPHVLKKTLDYLIEEVIGNAPGLHDVHGFLWDRTRAIRNDFSIQQCTKIEDLRVAIDCYERIARFHIVSLHELAVLPKPYDAYDPQQEREQLDRTLLSLIQYYDDVRGRLPLPNEAEFRAYCVIKQLQDPTPDLEDRVQCWPKEIVLDRRVQTALDLYAAACNTMDSQGPLKPRATHLIAQQDWQKFWRIVSSPKVSYLMGCVAEIYFNLVRRTLLNALWRACNGNPRAPPQDLTIEYLAELMKLDEEEQVRTFCEAHGFSFAEGPEGEYLNLSSVRGSGLPRPDRNLPRQWKSSLVEDKRFGRTIPAILNGLSVKQAAEAGLIVEDEQHEEDVETAADEMDTRSPQFAKGVADPVDDGESLFLPETAHPSAAAGMIPFGGADKAHTDVPASNSGAGSIFTFGQPSGGTFGKPSIGSSIFNAKPVESTGTFGKPSGGDDIFAQNKRDATGVFSQQPTDGSIFTRPSGAPAISTPGWNWDSTTAPSQQADKAALGTTTTAAYDPPAFAPPKFTPGTFSFGGPSVMPQLAQPPATPFFGFGTPSQIDKTEQPPSLADNDDGLPTQTFPWASQAKKDQHGDVATPGLLDANKQSAVESVPTLAATVGHEEYQTATGATSSIRQQTSKPEAKQSQAHFTPGSSPAAPVPSLPTSPTQQLRKPSTSHNKPNRPSPLANSFTFEDVSNPTAFSPSPTKPRAERQEPNAPALEDFDAIITRVAREATLEGGGIVDQYISFTVEKLMKSVKQEVELERDIRAAVDYRTHVLSYRYFNRWKSAFWAKRFEQRGAKRRERARQGLEELKKSQRLDSRGKMGVAVSSFAKSADNTHGASTTSNRQQALHNGTTTALDRPAHAASKRPHAARDPDIAAPPRENGHKRLEGWSHVDDRGRIAKPAPTTNSASADILRRSSYLGLSGQSRASEGSSITTRDPYFRLKAMGIKSRPSVESRGLKRRHEDDDDVGSRRSTPVTRSRTSSLLRSSWDGARPGDGMPPPAWRDKANDVQAVTRPQPVPANAEDDEALFARLRAARAALNESTTFLKAEVEMAEDLRRSLSASESSNESRSMARARAEARWRASHAKSPFAASTSGGAGVPAYRLRESRFVPREHYGRATDRANELRASRSAATSRAQSRDECPANPAPPIIAMKSKDSNRNEGSTSITPSVKSPIDLSGLSPSGWQPPATVQESVISSSHQAQQPAPSFTNIQNSAFGAINGNGKNSPPLSQDPFIVNSGFPSLPAVDSSTPLLGHTQGSLGVFDHRSGTTNGRDGKDSQRSRPDFTGPPPPAQESLLLGSSQPLFVKSPTPPAELAGSGRSPQALYQNSGVAGQNSAKGHWERGEGHSQPSYATYPAQRPQDNGVGYEEIDEALLDASGDEQDVPNSYMHTNPFSLSSNEAMGGDTEEDTDGEDGEDGETVEYEEESEAEVHSATHGYSHADELSQEGTESAGDYDEDDMSGNEKDSFDDAGGGGDGGTAHRSRDHQMSGGGQSDIENGESDQASGDEDLETHGLQGVHFWNPVPAKNEALQGIGQTEADAIELDSD